MLRSVGRERVECFLLVQPGLKERSVLQVCFCLKLTPLLCLILIKWEDSDKTRKERKERRKPDNIFLLK